MDSICPKAPEVRSARCHDLVADDAGCVDAALFGHELVYFCSEHIENAEASRARVCLLVHDINSELHPLAVDVHSFDRAAFRDAIKVVRECSSCVISARQLHMPRRFDGHRLPPGSV
jgi:hypothetical protein